MFEAADLCRTADISSLRTLCVCTYVVSIHAYVSARVYNYVLEKCKQTSKMQKGASKLPNLLIQIQKTFS